MNKTNILTPFRILQFALILRILDIFVLLLDKLLGEIILSKALGFVLVVVYVWLGGLSSAISASISAN